MAKRNNPTSNVVKIAKGTGATFAGEGDGTPQQGETKGFKFGLGWNKKSKSSADDPIMKFANSL